MLLHVLQTLSHRNPRSRQETRAHPVSEIAKAQIQARRLQLIFGNRLVQQYSAIIDQALNRLGGKYAVSKARGLGFFLQLRLFWPFWGIFLRF